MKQKAFRRALAWALALIMALSALPFAALAEGTEPAPAGQESPKIEEPKQETPAPKAGDGKDEEPKAEDARPQNEAGASAAACGCTEKCTADTVAASGCEVCKTAGENLGTVCRGAEMISLQVTLHIDNAAPTTGWQVLVYREPGDSTPFRQTDCAAGSDSTTFRLPAKSYYFVTAKAVINGNEVGYRQQADPGQTAAFNYYTQTKPGTVVFSGSGLFEGCQYEILNPQALVDSAMTPDISYKYASADIFLTLSQGLGTSYLLSAKYNVLDNSISPTDIPNAAINLKLTGLNRRLAIRNVDGTPISTDSTSETYYTSTDTTLELHNFRPGDYQFRDFYTDPVTVTFDGGEGTVSQSSVTVESGTELDLSAFTASRFGYHFDGWEKNDGYSAGNSITPTENTTLYALWDPVKITVYDGWTGSLYEYTPALDGTAIKDYTDHDGDFYWGCSDEQGKIWTKFDFSEDRELTARYFKLFLNGINEQGTDKPWLVTDAPELRDSFPYTGLADLVTQMNITAAEIASSEALTALARQTLQSENVQLRGLDIGVTLTKGGETAPLTEFSRTLLFYIPWSGSADRVAVLRTHDGKTEVLPQGKPADDTAEGWYIENGRLYFAIRKFSEYAIAAAPYTVSFDSNGGSNSPLPMTTGTDGRLANLPSPGARTGYTFSGWKNGEQAVDENTVYTGDATLTAEWIPITYNVIFDANGGVNANGAGSQSFRDVKYGETLSPAAVTRASHRFLGWSRRREGGQTVTDLQNLTATQGETVTLYARWEYRAKNITFDADGGIINSSGSRVPTIAVQTQTEPLDTIDASRFPMPEARRYLTFVGWFTEPEGQGVQVFPSGSGDSGTVFTGDATVYAYWRYDPLTVTLNCKGGTVRVDGKDVKKAAMRTQYPGVLDGELPTPTRKGYTFLGWYLSDGTKVDDTTVFEKDTTIYAHWQGTGKWNPKTGDQVRLGLALAVLAAAAIGLGAAILLRKRKK